MFCLLRPGRHRASLTVRWMNLLVTPVVLVRGWLVTIVLYSVDVNVLLALRATNGSPVRVSLRPLVMFAEVDVIQP